MENASRLIYASVALHNWLIDTGAGYLQPEEIEENEEQQAGEEN